MGARFCPNCGSAVNAAAAFCERCGARTAGTAPTPAAAPSPTTPPSYAPPPYAPPSGYAPAPPPPAYPYVASPYPAAPYPAPPYPVAPYPAYDYAAAERQKQVGRTKTGLLFLAIGFLAIGFLLSLAPIFEFLGAIAILAAIPAILGGILAFLGAILTVLGRRAFGERHDLFVVLAIIVFFVGGGVAIGAGVSFAFQLFLAESTSTVSQAATAVRNLMIGSFVGAAVVGISFVLFVHELVNKAGKYLLYAGYAAIVAANAFIVAYISPLIDAAVATGDLTAVLAVSDQLTTLGLFDAVSSIIFAGAYFIAYSRIQRGEIPPPVEPPTSAPGWQVAEKRGSL